MNATGAVVEFFGHKQLDEELGRVRQEFMRLQDKIREADAKEGQAEAGTK